MDGFAYGVMQFFVILVAVGTIGGSLFVGHVWRKGSKN